MSRSRARPKGAHPAYLHALSDLRHVGEIQSRFLERIVARIPADYAAAIPIVSKDLEGSIRRASQHARSEKSLAQGISSTVLDQVLKTQEAILAGSMGMLPSASLGGRVGLYEPVHGTAPDIAGRGVANPIAAILSAAMLLRYSLNRGPDADRIEAAVLKVLGGGARTVDIHSAGMKLVGTVEMGDLIAREVERSY